jgi:activator of 2-hydroxyglutaryl-CoA dehydratase
MSLDSLVGNEYAWHAETNDWRRAKTITAGIDVGSSGSQAVVVVDKDVFAVSNVRERTSGTNAAVKALNAALNGTGMTPADIHHIVGTGCGGADPIVKRTVSEIACHARGVNYSIGSSVRTVLVMGGQDCAATHCNENGRVTGFLMNACRPARCKEDSCCGCGAAQGQGIVAVAETLAVPIEEVGTMSLSIDDAQVSARLSMPFDERGRVHDEMLEEIGDEVLADSGPSPVSGALGVVCAVIAQAHAAAMLRNGWSKAEIMAVYCAAMAHQAAFLARRLGPIEDFAVTGGVARNPGVVKRLERELGMAIAIPKLDPQLTGALGAALLAKDSMDGSGQAARPRGRPNAGSGESDGNALQA